MMIAAVDTVHEQSSTKQVPDRGGADGADEMPSWLLEAEQALQENVSKDDNMAEEQIARRVEEAVAEAEAKAARQAQKAAIAAGEEMARRVQQAVTAVEAAAASQMHEAVAAARAECLQLQQRPMQPAEARQAVVEQTRYDLSSIELPRREVIQERQKQDRAQATSSSLGIAEQQIAPKGAPAAAATATTPCIEPTSPKPRHVTPGAAAVKLVKQCVANPAAASQKSAAQQPSRKLDASLVATIDEMASKQLNLFEPRDLAAPTAESQCSDVHKHVSSEPSQRRTMLLGTFRPFASSNRAPSATLAAPRAITSHTSHWPMPSRGSPLAFPSRTSSLTPRTLHSMAQSSASPVPASNTAAAIPRHARPTAEAPTLEAMKLEAMRSWAPPVATSSPLQHNVVAPTAVRPTRAAPQCSPATQAAPHCTTSASSGTDVVVGQLADFDPLIPMLAHKPTPASSMPLLTPSSTPKYIKASAAVSSSADPIAEPLLTMSTPAADSSTKTALMQSSAIESLKDMFPHLQQEIIAAVLDSAGSAELALNHLLLMCSDNVTDESQPPQATESRPHAALPTALPTASTQRCLAHSRNVEKRVAFRNKWYRSGPRVVD